MHRMMRADEFQQRGLPLAIGIERALERGGDLCRLSHALGVQAQRLGHVGGADGLCIRHLPCVWVVALAPEAGAIARIAAVINVNDGDASL